MYRLLKSARIGSAAAVAAAFVALALSVGSPARADASLTEDQAKVIAAVAAASEDETRIHGDDVQVAESVIVPEPDETPAWFPEFDADALTLTPPPIQTTSFQTDDAAHLVITNEHAVIPLPPAAWTGLAGLASLATIGGRKAILRFFT
ncbi:MAG: hypothetical protein QOE14_1386 [Humisphaera sp.]|nr:hypothetical protein [Humisphaera sp.]